MSSLGALINARSISELTLLASLNLFDDDVARLLSFFSALLRLDVSRCLELSDLTLIHIVESPTQLDTLYLSNLPLVSKQVVAQLVAHKKSITRLEWKGQSAARSTASSTAQTTCARSA